MARLRSREALLYLAAAALAAAVLYVQHRRAADPHVVHTRFDLPGFDPYVYVAMADHPAFFTVAPWGYRVLGPWTAAALPGGVLRGFAVLTFAGLGAAALLMFAEMRSRGHAAWAGLLGVAAFAASGPVAQAVARPFLVEPPTVALEAGLLLALARGAGAGTLALLATAGALGKEFFLLLVPVVFLLRRREGARRALLETLIVGGAALAALGALRLYWTPHIHGPLPRGSGAMAGLVLARVQEFGGELMRDLLLGGLLPVALVGALRRPAVDDLLARAWIVLVTVVPPLLNPVGYFPGDPPRLLLYALPALVPLAVQAVDPVAPARAPVARRAVSPWVTGAAAALLLAFVLTRVDRYRRLDLQGPRDGPFVLATCRETLRYASRLERGEEVSYDPAWHQYEWGRSDPGRLDRMRWFLRGGWGRQAHYGTGPIVMRETEATLLLPVFSPRPLEVDLDLAAVTAPLRVRVGERVLGTAGEGRTRLLLPADTLVRGDHLLTLSGAPGARLLRVDIRPAAR